MNRYRDRTEPAAAVAVQGNDAAIAALDAALRAELDLTEPCAHVLRPPRPAEGWRLLLTLALVALHTDCTRDTLALNWHQSAEQIDAALAPFVALGLVGEGRHGPIPTPAGFVAVVKHLGAVGQLVLPEAAK